MYRRLISSFLISSILLNGVASAGPHPAIRTESHQFVEDMSIGSVLRKSGHTSLIKKLFGERVPAVRIKIQDLIASLQRTLRTGSAPEARKLVVEMFPFRKGIPIAVNIQDMSFLVEHAELRMTTALARLRNYAELSADPSFPAQSQEKLVELAKVQDEAYLESAEHFGRYVAYYRAIMSHLEWVRKDATVTTPLAKQNAEYLLEGIGIRDWRFMDLLKQDDQDFNQGRLAAGLPPALPGSGLSATENYLALVADGAPSSSLTRLWSYRPHAAVIASEQDHERAVQLRHAGKRLLTSAPIEKIFRWLSRHDTALSDWLQRAKMPDFTQVLDKLTRFQETLDWNDQYGYELLELSYNWANLSALEQVKELVRLQAKGNEEDQKNHVVFKYLARRLDLRDLWFRVRDAAKDPENAVHLNVALTDEIARLEESRRKGELLGIDPQNRPGVVRVLKDYLVMILTLYFAGPMVANLTGHASKLGEVACEKIRAAIAEGRTDITIEKILSCPERKP